MITFWFDDESSHFDPLNQDESGIDFFYSCMKNSHEFFPATPSDPNKDNVESIVHLMNIVCIHM